MTQKNKFDQSIASAYQLYFAEIQKYPLLTVEEEKKLALDFFKNKNAVAAQKLALHNLRFVVTIANKYAHYGIKIMDLIQEGNIGLMRAIQTYNPYKDVRLITYAVWWIRSYIHDYIQKNWSVVKVATTQAQRRLFYKLKKEQEELEHLGLSPTTKLLAERLHVPEKDVAIMEERLSQKDVSLDTPLKSDTKKTHLENIKDEGTFPDVMLEKEEEGRLIRQKLQEFGNTLKDKDKYIFEKRIVAEKPMTLQAIGKKYKISRERVRQIEFRVKKNLKIFFIREMPQFTLK